MNAKDHTVTIPMADYKILTKSLAERKEYEASINQTLLEIIQAKAVAEGENLSEVSLPYNFKTKSFSFSVSYQQRKIKVEFAKL
jgi:hypothetical protein